MKILIETVPHSQQRYDTAGDWYEEDGVWHIRVSNLGCWQQEFLIALHELVEMAACHENDVHQELVDAFDQAWKPGGVPGVTEPGDDIMCPYWEEHQIASGIERLTAAALHVNWVEYCRAVEALSQNGENADDQANSGSSGLGDPST